MLRNVWKGLTSHRSALSGTQARFLQQRLRSSNLIASSSVTAGPRMTNQRLTDAHAEEIITYWLGSLDPTKPASFPSDKKKLWFSGGPAVDKEIKAKFGATLEHAADTGLPEWQRHRNGLAAVLLMDQFSRNVYRGSAQMYDLDEKAMSRAQQLMDSGDAASFLIAERLWLALPFTHSEKVQDQQAAMGHIQQMLDEAKSLNNADDLQNYLQAQLQYAEAHLKVVKQWGRFPHRNAILGRANTPEEVEGMADGKIPSF